MRFTARVPLIILALTAMLSTAGTAADNHGMIKRIVSSSEHRTVMRLYFDENAVLDAAASLEFNQDIRNNYGTLLAIAGSGTPTAHILDLELGETVRGYAALDESEVPHSPADLLRVGTPAILHDLRIVPVNAAPVMLDEAGSLRTVRSLEIEVTTSGAGGENTKSIPQTFSSAFYPVYRSMIDNLDELYPNRSLRSPGRFLVLGNTQLLNQIALDGPFLNWLNLKRRKGYTVEIKSLADVHAAVGDSSENGIRAFFDNTYHDENLPGLEYAVILGDMGGSFEVLSKLMQNPEFPNIPAEVSVGDNFYFAIDGNDYITDVFYGRISGDSRLEYLAYFNKALFYETNPFLDDRSWFESVSCVAGNFSDGGGTFPVTPVWNMNWTRETIMRDGCISDADTFYFHDNSEFPGQYTESIGLDISEGVCAVFYRGWANALQWAYPVYGNPQVENLQLGRRNPAVFGIVCGSGDFAEGSGRCLGETFTTGIGLPASPNGAIIYFGASDLHTNTKHNNAMLAGIITSLLNEGVRSGAALALAGKLEVYKQFPLERDDGANVHFYGFHVFNLLGDPETQIYFCQPGDFTLDHPATLSPADNLVQVRAINGSGIGIEGAAVTLRDASNPENIAAAITDADGYAWLPADLTDGENAELTVWRAEYFQQQIDIPVSASGDFDPYVTTTEWDAGDDELPNPGEQVSFRLRIENRGGTGHQPTITVTSDDPHVEVLEGNPTIGFLNPGAWANSQSVLIRIGELLPDRSLPVLNVALDEINRTIQIPIAAPIPLVWDFHVQDANGVLEPGETVEVAVSLRNVGSADSEPVTANISSFDNAITITNGELNWDALPRDEIVMSNNSFTATVPSDATPGREVMIRFGFTMNGATFSGAQRPLTIGVVDIHAPTGPDAYGYYAYEDVDTGFDATPTYNWIELNPDSGGTSDAAHEVRDDTHFGIELPTPFQFYGQSFDSIWICSNGWISFEHATIPEFRNWEIPSPIGPPSMVCPYWDDLISFTDNEDEFNDNHEHHIYTRNDGNRFIIMWQTLNRRGLEGTIPSTDFCTFEMILEYADHSILCQYKQISNIDAKQNYATIGIQNSDHTDGLGLTYANHYLVSVDSIRAGRAIRFSTDAPDGYLDADDADPNSTLPLEFALHPAFPNPFNPSTELRFDLIENGSVMLKIYDVLGREAAVLVNENLPAGSHRAIFTATGLPSGLYFARLTAGSEVVVQKLMLVK